MIKYMPCLLIPSASSSVLNSETSLYNYPSFPNPIHLCFVCSVFPIHLQISRASKCHWSRRSLGQTVHTSGYWIVWTLCQRDSHWPWDRAPKSPPVWPRWLAGWLRGVSAPREGPQAPASTSLHNNQKQVLELSTDGIFFLQLNYL